MFCYPSGIDIVLKNVFAAMGEKKAFFFPTNFSNQTLPDRATANKLIYGWPQVQIN